MQAQAAKKAATMAKGRASIKLEQFFAIKKIMRRG